MKQSDFITKIQEKDTYKGCSGPIQLLQTHISYVILTGKYAYKIKKPVDFGFLDFSTLDKRKQFCAEELRLNKRLCPELYIDVISYTETPEHLLEINGSGPLVEYAVKMKQFSQNHIMAAQLKKGAVTFDHIKNITKTLVSFYEQYSPNEEVVSYGKPSMIKQNIDENFQQTESVIDQTISKDTYQFIKKVNADFFTQAASVLTERMQNGFIHECHGDLHSGNIVINKDDTICIFDCIEFNKRFRFIDIASDIGFLAMDLDYQNHPFLSAAFIQQYKEMSADDTIDYVLNFYKSYRAYVRGKIYGFQIHDESRSKNERQQLISTAQRYFQLSKYYAMLVSVQLQQNNPLLIIVSGLSGTGKSTLTLKLSVDYRAMILNTDVIRKHKAGIPLHERHFDEPDTGLYDPKHSHNTYTTVLDLAKTHLEQKKNVIIDATFQKKSYRDAARKIAEETKSIPIFIFCMAPEDQIKTWLHQRLQQKTASDGRWEIYQRQKKTYEQYTTDESKFIVDLSKNTMDQRMEQFNTIAQHILEVIT